MAHWKALDYLTFFSQIFKLKETNPFFVLLEIYGIDFLEVIIVQKFIVIIDLIIAELHRG